MCFSASFLFLLKSPTACCPNRYQPVQTDGGDSVCPRVVPSGVENTALLILEFANTLSPDSESRPHCTRREVAEVNRGSGPGLNHQWPSTSKVHIEHLR